MLATIKSAERNRTAGGREPRGPHKSLPRLNWLEFVAFLIVTGIALSYVFDGEAEQGLDRLKDLSAYCVVLAGWFAVFWGLVEYVRIRTTNR